MAVCEILSVGTEILLGDILNTDTQFLSRELAAVGIGVMHHATVGDNDSRLAQALHLALSRSDIVIVSGGLGPTADDITREVCCREMGFTLKRDESIAQSIRSFFEARGYEMPENNLRQADVPVGGTVFRNKNGTAPGLALERGGKCVIMLPGPPGELEAMYRDSVKDFLSKYSDGVIISHTVHVMGLGESAMANKVRDLLDMANPTVAPYAKQGEALLRVTAKASGREQAEQLCKPVIDDILSRLGDVVYGIDCGNTETAVFSLLRERGLTLASAESCTGGLIAKRMTDLPGSSAVFSGGIVAYTNEVKMKLLGVKAQTLDSFGAVSEQTACEMAMGAVRATGAALGVSSTGIAGPGSDGSGTPAGVSYVAVSDGERTVAQRVETGRQSREFNRHVTASRALNLVMTFLHQ